LYLSQFSKIFDLTCRNDVAELKVRCGEWDTQTTSEPYPHQDRAVKALRIHPEYEGRALFNDFAVLFLESNFDLDVNLDSVCLPQPDEAFDGSTCFATGWGKDKFGSAGEYQVVLKEIDLPIVSNDIC
jgi:kallikrein